MYFSFNKLKAMAQLDKKISVQEVIKAINAIGFEVEGYKPFSDVKNIKFGQVLKTYKNQNSDKLNVCEIKFADKVRTIQTTASNVKENDIIIAFVPGSQKGDITFSAKEMQGIASEGMLSNIVEFGVSKDYLRTNWIEEIGIYNSYQDITLDTDPIIYLGLDDQIIEVDILSNRADAKSYFVMAREIAAYFGKKYDFPAVNQGTLKTNLSVANGQALSLTFIEASLKNEVTIQDQLSLAKHHIKSINDSSDLSNLTLIHTGQPTHAYDKAQLSPSFGCKEFSGPVNVFGNKEINLDNNLVITNNDDPVSIASVIGLEAYKTTNLSKDLYLELGIFDSQKVRASAKKCKLNSEASKQGTKNINQGLTHLAISYLSNKLHSFSLPINLQPIKLKSVTFNKKRFETLIGKSVEKDQQFIFAQQALTNLGFDFKSDQVTIPSYRYDIEVEEDIFEEILRFYGYNNLEEKMFNSPPFKVNNYKDIKNAICDNGFFEVRPYTLTSNQANIFNPFGFEQELILQSNYTSERSVIRNSQFTSLQEIAEYNFKRKLQKINIFARGMIGHNHISYGLFSNQKSFYELQQIIKNILPTAVFARAKIDYFHPNICAHIIVNKKVVGMIAKTHPGHAQVEGIYAEFLEIEDKTQDKYQAYDQAPIKFTDHTFSLKLDQDLQQHLEQFHGAIKIEVIDNYQKEDANHVTVRVWTK